MHNPKLMITYSFRSISKPLPSILSWPLWYQTATPTRARPQSKVGDFHPPPKNKAPLHVTARPEEYSTYRCGCQFVAKMTAASTVLASRWRIEIRQYRISDRCRRNTITRTWFDHGQVRRISASNVTVGVRMAVGIAVCWNRCIQIRLNISSAIRAFASARRTSIAKLWYDADRFYSSRLLIFMLFSIVLLNQVSFIRQSLKKPLHHVLTASLSSLTLSCCCRPNSRSMAALPVGNVANWKWIFQWSSYFAQIVNTWLTYGL